MLNSAEVRWFWAGSLPAGLDSWFRSGPFPPGGGQLRVDAYLLDPSQVELGLKKRGDKNGIEVKGLVTTLSEPIQIGSVIGQIQIWTKWTSGALELPAIDTVELHKTRWLRKFETSGGAIHEIALNAKELPSFASDNLPAQGCNVELTNISLGKTDTKWWTLGFEAFGKVDSIERSLRFALNHLTATTVPALQGGLELSYPAWLSMHLYAAA